MPNSTPRLDTTLMGEDQLKQYQEIMRRERERFEQAEREKARLREQLEELRRQRKEA